MKPIKVDHWVRTADGSIGRVRYATDTSADVAIDNNYDNTVTLPIAELKRVPNPNDKRVPVEDIPEPRKRCEFCNRPLKFMTDDTRAKPYSSPTKRVFLRWTGYPHQDPLFCTLDHALAFAVASFKAGMRIVRKG